MPTYVTNTKDHLVHCHSSDGNSVPVGPRARGVTVANRFTWQVDEGIILGETLPEDDVDPCAHVRGRPLAALMRAPRTVEEAQKISARGLHPHQTPSERSALRRKAQKILDDQRKRAATSGDAMDRARERIPSSPPSRPSDAQPDDHSTET